MVSVIATMMPLTLFWWSPYYERWMPTTAPTTDTSANQLRRMGYAVRIQESPPVGRPDEVDLALVRDAGGGPVQLPHG